MGCGASVLANLTAPQPPHVPKPGNGSTARGVDESGPFLTPFSAAPPVAPSPMSAPSATRVPAAAADASTARQGTAVASSVSATDAGGRTEPAGDGGLTSSAQVSSEPPDPLLGRTKYIKSYGALTMEDRTRRGVVQGLLFLFCEAASSHVIVSYRENLTGSVFARTFTDEELLAAKQKAGIVFSWAPFFKSIAVAMLKGTVEVTSTTPTRKMAQFAITKKGLAQEYPFTVTLELVSYGESPCRVAVFDFVMEPLTRLLRRRNPLPGHTLSKSSDPAEVAQMETETAARAAALKRHKSALSEQLPKAQALSEESVARAHAAVLAVRDLRESERKLRLARQPRRSTQKRHPLDALYDGGLLQTAHVKWSVPFVPCEMEPDATLTTCIKAAFPLPAGVTIETIGSVLERPEILQLVKESGRRSTIEAAFRIFAGIDRWEYDTVQLEIVTRGNALFFTAYLIFCKLQLMEECGLDDAVVRRFLVAIQSSYHPNPYHNAMHGADVTHINYYMLMVGGLAEHCRLSKLDLLTAILAAIVHDVDHPGLNNHFHVRTKAPLATVYNDHSILENHHLAYTFELLQHPRYNFLNVLTHTQWQEMRATMVEMVLATDMAQHAKLLKQFQQRVAEGGDWSVRVEDKRLALCMALKLADISNCVRPSHIYGVWAKCIAEEFYLQGDAEQKLQMSVSPYMDRSKDKEEFGRGQISFMLYIVQPMVEVVAELLPALSFTVELCNANLEYWKKKAQKR